MINGAAFICISNSDVHVQGAVMNTACTEGQVIIYESRKCYVAIIASSHSFKTGHVIGSILILQLSPNITYSHQASSDDKQLNGISYQLFYFFVGKYPRGVCYI